MKDALKNISWPGAVVVSTGFLALVILVILHADTSALMLLLGGLIGGAGAEQLRGLREQTNGNMSRLLDELSKTRDALVELARRLPPEG